MTVATGHLVSLALCRPVVTAVLFLAPDLARSITGVLLPIDGGILSQPLEGASRYVDRRRGSGG